MTDLIRAIGFSHQARRGVDSPLQRRRPLPRDIQMVVYVTASDRFDPMPIDGSRLCVR